MFSFFVRDKFFLKLLLGLIQLIGLICPKSDV